MIVIRFFKALVETMQAAAESRARYVLKQRGYHFNE